MQSSRTQPRCVPGVVNRLNLVDTCIDRSRRALLEEHAGLVFEKHGSLLLAWRRWPRLRKVALAHVVRCHVGVAIVQRRVAAASRVSASDVRRVRQGIRPKLIPCGAVCPLQFPDQIDDVAGSRCVPKVQRPDADGVADIVEIRLQVLEEFQHDLFAVGAKGDVIDMDLQIAVRDDLVPRGLQELSILPGGSRLDARSRA